MVNASTFALITARLRAWYLLMPASVEQKGLLRKSELRCSWDGVLLGSTTAGLCSGI